MGEAAVRTRMTPEDYLAFERAAEQKHEFANGEVFAMSGGTRAHALLSANFLGELRNALVDRPCEVYTSDLRVKIPAAPRYVYPDVSVACGDVRFEDDHGDTLLTPLVVVEVLSDSSEAYDRGDKFALYRSVPSVSDYVLVSQKAVQVEHYRRDADGSWRLVVLGRGDALALASVGARVEVDRVYAKVTLVGATEATAAT